SADPIFGDMAKPTHENTTNGVKKRAVIRPPCRMGIEGFMKTARRAAPHRWLRRPSELCRNYLSRRKDYPHGRRSKPAPPNASGGIRHRAAQREVHAGDQRE